MLAQTPELVFQNPQGAEIAWPILQDFERGLDPLKPEANPIPCRVLGYGEISTAFEIQAGGMSGLAFKRMSCFKTTAELQPYITAYLTYSRLLEQGAGLRLPAYGFAAFNNQDRRPVLYIIQQRLDPDSIGNHAIQFMPPAQIVALFCQVLHEMHKVWAYNQQDGEYRLSIDGQISNWAIGNFDPTSPQVDCTHPLVYIDTSTPLYLHHGIVQMDVELFLRSAPPYLAWVLRLLFLQDVRTRYFDPRKVLIDLIANFYKEQQAGLVPELVAAANEYLGGEAAGLGLEPITQNEVQAYYRSDATLWRLYLGMRRFDRFIRRKVLRRNYPYILPGKTRR